MDVSEAALPTPHNRFLGFDLLRGLCALSVALYHLLSWQGVADFHLVGSYAVYMFFILSGASITIAYADKFKRGMHWGEFLGRRFFRLAPLYWLAVLSRGHFGKHWAQVGLNLSFLFGFANPAVTSRVTGGGSLGIEFVFYLTFPFFLILASGTWRPWLVLAGLTGLQLLYIDSLITVQGDLVKHVAAYTQFMSFIAYFFGGCVIGMVLKRYPVAELPQWVLWAAFAVLLAALFYSGAHSFDTGVKGAKGLAFIVACLLAVLVSGLLVLRGIMAHVAHMCGNLSYGVYLLHPLIYTYYTNHIGAGALENTPWVAGVVLAVAVPGALLLERFFERPIKQAGYRLMKRAA